MIIFKKITWQNFLSTGNVPNTIDLNKHHSTLITGKNGEGKSTVLCALTFALFGKPFRDITKGQLVNSINKKNCLVEIEFSVGGSNYVVRRGIKPNVFEIIQNGTLINQEAAVKDYQKVLEQQILKLNYKTFTQVVILGSASFVPFMQLPAGQRREVIEDILDIKIFSVMNSLLKDKISETKTEISRVENLIINQKQSVESQRKLIDVLVNSKKDIVDNLQTSIDTNNKTIQTMNDQIEAINLEIDTLRQETQKQTSVEEYIEKARDLKTKVKSKIETCNHDVEFFSNHDTCPSCSQHIDEEYKQTIITELNTKLQDSETKLSGLESYLEKMHEEMKHINNVLDQIRTKNIEVSTLQNTIRALTSQNTQIQTDIDNTQQDTGNIDEEKEKLSGMIKEAMIHVEAKKKLLEDRELQEIASTLLKDTGIKTAIIREYLPVMNKLINKYLSAMDFYVKFELDESFNEVIKSRNRDEFTYSSFSEGEKRRLDLAILFTWRQIAKMKNSVNTNLMILDEILDGALDTGGIDYFLSIMNQFGDNTNVFVISHKVDQMIERFDNVIRVEKKNEFSVIT